MTQRSVVWSELRAPELRELTGPQTSVIVPVGSIEQHGPHLPTMTDTILANEVARRAAQIVAAKKPILVTECVWSGLSEHHMAFGATITIDFNTMFQLVSDVVSSLRRLGFRRVLLLNSHGGNVAALKTIVEQLTMRDEMPLVCATYWHLAAHLLEPVLDRQKGIRHACEAETAMMLALRPDLVDVSQFAAASCPDPKDAPSQPDDGYRWRSFAQITHSGAIGEPQAATAEKGQKLLTIASQYLAQRLLDDGFWGE